MIGTERRPLLLAKARAVEEPVDPGQPDVEEDRIGDTLDKQAFGLDHMPCVADLEPLQLERGTNEIANRLVVVDYENVLLGHLTPLGFGSFFTPSADTPRS